ncbi:MAG TPA: hypothetical protein VFO70_00600 [Chitinophagaceae bacterium]|nr:hypothetical protein [Chitinophagaceae bacterium]
MKLSATLLGFASSFPQLIIILSMINLVISCSSPKKSNNTEDGGNSRATTDITNKDTIYVQDTSKKVADQTITINVSYAAIECGCPQWFDTKGNAVAYLEGIERFYLEPINKDLINANDLWDGEHLPLILKVTGRFSKEKEIPITYHIKGTIQKARIFWYDNITVVSSSPYKGIGK